MVSTFFGERHPVVLEEDDFQTIAHYWVVVHDLPDGSDEPDDHLRRVVSWCSLDERQDKPLRDLAEERRRALERVTFTHVSGE